jgi:hypothetical protein
VLLALALCVAPARGASLYLPAGDGRLRSDLALLIDAGVLDLSATAWPLPRAELERALADARVDEDSALQYVLERVRRVAVGHESGTFSTHFVAGHPGLLRDFETAGREDATATLSAAFSGTRWSTTLVAAGVTDPADNHALRFDGSELTVAWGNWLLSANALERWWGPGQQSSLILSNNARPIPALMLDRAAALAPEGRLLSWIGPWRFTALLGQADGSLRDIARPYFTGLRFEMQPSPWVDVGAQRTARSGGGSLTAFDLRIEIPGPLPAGFYTQWIGEDVHHYLPTKCLGLLGVEAGRVAASGASWRSYVEYSATTNVAGYRYYGRSIGGTTDNDARLWVVGLRHAAAVGGEWHAKILAGTLNRGRTDPLQPDPTNSVAAVATQYRAAELGWQGDAFIGNVGVQLGIERLRPVGQNTKNQAYGFLGWERGL